MAGEPICIDLTADSDDDGIVSKVSRKRPRLEGRNGTATSDEAQSRTIAARLVSTSSQSTLPGSSIAAIETVSMNDRMREQGGTESSSAAVGSKDFDCKRKAPDGGESGRQTPSPSSNSNNENERRCSNREELSNAARPATEARPVPELISGVKGNRVIEMITNSTPSALPLPLSLHSYLLLFFLFGSF